MSKLKSYLFTTIVLSISLIFPFMSFANTTQVNNNTPTTISGGGFGQSLYVIWQAWGCFGMAEGYTRVCKSTYPLNSQQSDSYAWKEGQTGKQVHILWFPGHSSFTKYICTVSGSAAEVNVVKASGQYPPLQCQ